MTVLPCVCSSYTLIEGTQHSYAEWLEQAFVDCVLNQGLKLKVEPFVCLAGISALEGLIPRNPETLSTALGQTPSRTSEAQWLLA